MTGTDQATGAPASVTIRAGSLGEVEAVAAELGLKVGSIELDAGEQAAEPQSGEAAADPLSGVPSETRGSNTATPSSEEPLWSGRPSQWLNLGSWAALFGGAIAAVAVLTTVSNWGWLAAALAIVPLPWAGWRWLRLRLTRYELTRERIRVRSGVFTRHLEEIEIYRVKDTELTLAFWQRLVGIGTVVIHSSDQTRPILPLAGIAGPEQVRESIRQACEASRRARGVRELDVS